MARGEKTTQKKKKIQNVPKPKVRKRAEAVLKKKTGRVSKKADKTNHGIREALKWKKTVKGEKEFVMFMGKKETEILSEKAVGDAMTLKSLLENGKPKELDRWV
ncbi:hypothetical protein JXB01_03340 [Candidatus Micrarchaeota archaeon]|nr:hypothetical protein [Candidatus Micrarchaeota archaeon]